MAQAKTQSVDGQRITYTELSKKAEAGDLTKTEVKRYFQVDEKAQDKHRFEMKLTPGTVDLEGKRPTAKEVGELLKTFDEERKKPKLPQTVLPEALAEKMTAAKKAKAVKTRVLAEGDSWFNLPPFIKPIDAMDVLDQTHDLKNLAIFRDTLDNMIKEKDYVHDLKAGTFGFFFFSGGGNDVLASIDAYILPRKAGDTNPANAHKYVSPSFTTTINKAMGKYRTLIADVHAVAAAADVVTFLHGYANAIPIKNGKNIGKFLQAKGFDPVQHQALCRAIVAHMVGLFNDGLKDLAAQTSRVVYIDLRDIMKDTDWYSDEIHPNANGARKIAAEFSRRIAGSVPTV